MNPHLGSKTPVVPDGEYEVRLGERVLAVVVNRHGAVSVAGESGVQFPVTGPMRKRILKAIRL